MRKQATFTCKFSPWDFSCVKNTICYNNVFVVNLKIGLILGYIRKKVYF